ncbi:hypothetical protein DSM05_15940, partial [Pseudomonas sp. FW305-3-2-15-E-TSA4]|nr:hypothetical protein [Pseudomonas sp. FW305-3-2-15-E-TSA4]
VRVLSRSAIRGVGGTIHSRGGSYFQIIPLVPSEPTISLSASVREDPVVAAWLQGAPNPDAEKLAADRAAVLSDPRFGATQAERTTKLA